MIKLKTRQFVPCVLYVAGTNDSRSFQTHGDSEQRDLQWQIIRVRQRRLLLSLSPDHRMISLKSVELIQFILATKKAICYRSYAA